MPPAQPVSKVVFAEVPQRRQAAEAASQVDSTSAEPVVAQGQAEGLAGAAKAAAGPVPVAEVLAVESRVAEPSVSRTQASVGVGVDRTAEVAHGPTLGTTPTVMLRQVTLPVHSVTRFMLPRTAGTTTRLARLVLNSLTLLARTTSERTLGAVERLLSHLVGTGPLVELTWVNSVEGDGNAST